MGSPFEAFVVRETAPGVFEQSIETPTTDDLPSAELLIRVEYSSLNYKDALAATGRKGIMRYPGTPGVDAAGVIVESRDRRFTPGDQVMAGIDLRRTLYGAFERYIRVPAAWAMPLPRSMSMRDAAIYGAAGFTAGLSVDALQRNGVIPAGGEVLVTGATGGVGGFAVGLLSGLGYDVAAVSGKPEKTDYLMFLGASRVIDRHVFEAGEERALLHERWAGVIDTVGGNMLSTALRGAKYGGTVTCCGNVASNELCTSVFPFILRAVKLIGIDAVKTPTRQRHRIWAKLADAWRLDTLDSISEEISLRELSGRIASMIDGTHTGRTIVNLAATV